jgi:hypothetical protein
MTINNTMPEVDEINLVIISTSAMLPRDISTTNEERKEIRIILKICELYCFN